LPNERTRSTTGTGLGLHLVALQARAVRGKIEALSREGGGSVFRFTFRVA
jgi:signal transduction histidine kinase